MRDKNLSLIRWQLVECVLQRLEHQRASVERFGAGIVCREREVQAILAARFVLGVEQVGQRLLFLFAKTIDDAVARGTEKPRARLFDWSRQPIGLYEFVKHVLQDVLGIVRVADPAPDEIG